MEESLDVDLDSLIGLINENDSSVNVKTDLPKDTNKSLDSSNASLVDIFNTGSDNSTDVPLPQNAESSLIHTGDTSSDEEEKEYLTETGQNIKKKIAVKIDYENKRDRRNITWKTQRNSDTTSNEKPCSIDKYTGIRIVNPLVPFDVMEQRIQSRKVIKLSFLENYIKKGDIDGDWVTFGVVTRKIPPKTAKTGKLFSIWKLTDLHNTDKIVTLFLFGQVHHDHWKTAIGTVIGLLNPSIMSARDKNDELSISLDHPGKMMLVGTSKDFGQCKGQKKDGEKCNMIVNLSQCEYCVYHIRKEYKKFSQRSEIQTSYSGREPNLKNRVLKGHNFFYAGQSFVSSGKQDKKSSVTSKDKLILSNLTLKRKAAVVFNEEKAKSVKKLTEVYGDEISKAAEKNSEFINNQLVIPSVGSKNFLQYMLKNKIPKKEENICMMNPKEYFKQHKHEMQINIKNSSKKDDSLILKNLMPELGKGLNPGQNVSLDFSSSKLNTSLTSEDFAKMRAIKKIQANGPIKRKDPNSVKSQPEQKKIKVALDSSIKEDLAYKSKPDAKPALAVSRLGAIDLNSEKIQKILNMKSNHAYEVEMAEMEKEVAYFARLEKKEMMEEKMSSTKEMVCDVVSCKQCRYTAHNAADRCKQEGHPLKCHKAIKRFFECKDCKHRTESFTKFPLKACRNCGSSSFERTGMIKVRKGPRLDSEVLNIKWDDAYFLNSL